MIEIVKRKIVYLELKNSIFIRVYGTLTKKKNLHQILMISVTISLKFYSIEYPSDAQIRLNLINYICMRRSSHNSFVMKCPTRMNDMFESQEEVTERELSDLDWKVSFFFSRRFMFIKNMNIVRR